MSLNVNKKGILCICFLLSAFVGLKAQERPQIITDIEKNHKIEFEEPAQVEQLLMLQIANNALQKGTPGYRIRIFSKSGQTARQQEANTRSGFQENFPELKAYREYNEPNFQIFVGDFRTKTEALYHLKSVAKKYPSAFIVSSNININ